jgi:hypothetical protein
MRQSLSWEANSPSASQDIHWLLWNPQTHYHIHKSLPLFHIPRQMNPVHTFKPVYLRSSVTCPPNFTSLSNWSLPFKFSDWNFVFISHLSHVCYMPRHLITVLIFDEGTTYKAPRTIYFFLSGPDTHPQHPILSRRSQFVLFRQCDRPSLTSLQSSGQV